MQQAINMQELELAMNKYGDVVVTKNSKNNVVIMSIEQYNKGLKKEDIQKLKQAEEEIERGEGIESDVAFKALRVKYGY